MVAIATVAGNLALELVLIYGLGLGVGASAGATVVAKWAGAITYVGDRIESRPTTRRSAPTAAPGGT